MILWALTRPEIPAMETPLTPPAAGQPEPAGPLREEDFLRIRQAAEEFKAIRKTTGTAKTSATITLCIGVAALLWEFPFSDLLGTAVAAGVCAVGGVELAGYRRIRRGLPAGAGMLCVNQAAFLALIVAYCAIQMAAFSPEKAWATMVSPEFRSQLTALPDVEASVRRLAPVVVYGLYGGTILLSLLIQGRLAWTYHLCRGRMEAFGRGVPAWVQRVFREVEGADLTGRP